MPRIPPAPRHAYVDFSTLPTRWMDNDQYGHMNNMIHYSLIDTAVTNWQLQHRVFDRSGNDIRFLVVESGCVYHAEAGYPDLIHAGLRVGHIGSSSWRYEVGLFRNDDPLAFAEGFFSQVQVDAQTGKPMPLSAPYRDQLGQLIPPLGENTG
ncbi:MAG: acyl-CoA thioesterase [Paracoccaceae bacterium]